MELPDVGRPNKSVRIPFDMFMMLAVHYLAQLKDKFVGGEYAYDSELNWASLCELVDKKDGIQMSTVWLEHLLYSFKLSCADRRRVFGVLRNYYLNNYYHSMKKFKYLYPELFKEEEDGEIRMIGEPSKEKSG